MDGIRQLLITSLFPQGSSEKLIVHVKTYKDIQSSESSRDIRGTPRYLCLTRKLDIHNSSINMTLNICIRKTKYNTTFKSEKKPKWSI